MAHKIETVVYAQGYVEDFIESETELVTINDEMSDDTQQEAAEQNEYRTQVLAMWKVLSEGTDQIRRENKSLQNKLLLIQQAINTPT